MLVEFGESRKVVSLPEGKAICSIIKEAFDIDGEVIIQLFRAYPIDENRSIDDQSIITQKCS